jgi:pilus assembly protein CpaB
MAKKKLLIAAIIVGLFAAVLLYLYASQLNVKNEELLRDQREVVKAARNIQAGTPLTKDRITTEKVPQRFLPPNPLLEADLNIYLNTPLAVNVEQGAMILTSDFSVQEVSRTLSSKIPPDERAMSMPVDAISGVSGLLKPGDRVDILATFPVGNKDQVVVDERGEEGVGYITLSLLQNVTLLAVGQEISDVPTGDQRQQAGYSTVTLSVTIEEAELITISQTRGKMMLLLRNRDDVNMHTVSRRTLREVMEQLEIIQAARNVRVKPKAKPQVKEIEVDRGDKK